jgi:hypothetical protein
VDDRVKKNRGKGRGNDETEEVNYISPGAGKTRVPRNPEVTRDKFKECGKTGHTIDKCHKKHPHLFDEWLKKREAKEAGNKGDRGAGRK